MEQLDQILLSDLMGEQNIRSWNDMVLLNDNFTTGQGVPRYLTDSRPKRIRFATMMLCRQGEVDITLNMRQYHLQRNEALLISPGTIGEQNRVSDDCMMAVIAFSESVYNVSAKNSVSMQLRNFLHGDPVLIHFPQPYADKVIAHYRLMRDVLADVSFTMTEELVRSHINIISTYAVNCIEQEHRTPPEPSRYEVVLDSFLQLVKDNCMRERAMAFYADRLCLSPKYVSKVVLEASGRHPTEWIRDYVMLNAKALLRNSENSVQQVSEMMNFPNQSFFGKYFKRYEGCTPREYQNRK